MDKYQREQLITRANLILGDIGMNMALSGLVNHATKKYNAMVEGLSANLEEVRRLEGRRDTKGFLGKFKDKINSVSHEDRQIDDVLVDCARKIRRLEACKGCLCLDCVRDDCQFNCFVCPDGGKVVHCDNEGYCFRKVEKWYIPFHNVSYEVMATVSNLKNGKHYLFLKGRTNDMRKIVYYDIMTNKTDDVLSQSEYREVSEIVASVIGY